MSRNFRDESGITLVELMVASFGALIIAAVMLSWLVNVSQTDEYEQQASVALEEMRTAKARLVRDLRFADGIQPAPDSNVHQIQVSVEGDAVTWRLESDGTLTRTVAAGTPQQHAAHLVYDGVGGAGSSRFLYDNPAAPTQITIELVADVQSTTGPDPKQIRTDVHLRNV